MKVIDLTGKTFGKLTVIQRSGSNVQGEAVWLCQCDCGNKSLVSSSNLRTGNTSSCGCFGKEQRRKGTTIHGGCGTRLYHIWQSMHSRCERPTNNRYDRYGARGIRVCSEWSTFPPFQDWALSHGYSDTLTIDRKDNDRNYDPSNCRWATYKEQENNRSNNRR